MSADREKIAVVVVELAGGLGNQMFQYAAAQALAGKNDSGVVLDLRALRRDSLRKFELSRWRINARAANDRDLSRFPLWGKRAARRLLGLGLSTRYYIEPHFGFDDKLLDRKGSVHLSGYFQSEKYFLASRDILLQQFVPVRALSRDNASLAGRMAGPNSVSVHVRRGDYASNPRTLAVHGLCGVSYYERAFDVLRERIGAPTYFVFSDDFEWVERSIRFDGECVYVRGNRSHPEVDVYLMSLCAHNVCANSSFSWWGAWLNQRPDKLVIAPTRWFASSEYDSTQLIPESWLRIP